MKLDISDEASDFHVFSLILDDGAMNLILKASNEYGKKCTIPKNLIRKILDQKNTMKFQFKNFKSLKMQRQSGTTNFMSRSMFCRLLYNSVIVKYITYLHFKLLV